MYYLHYCVMVILFDSFECWKHFRVKRFSGEHKAVSADIDQHGIVPAEWFMQKLDHFTPTDERMWKQRYFVDDTFFDFKNGPIFLRVGGESNANAQWMVSGPWHYNAQEFKALCITLEHRYYGKSHPTNDLSVENLQYLSSQQALADVAYFIETMNKQYQLNDSNKARRWVAFGGSYAGALAAWLRVKYPHLVFASVSSSSPLHAKLDFKEYYEGFRQALRAKTSSLDCENKIKESHKELVDMIKKNPKAVWEDFISCEPYSNPSTDDLNQFYNYIAFNLAGIVQDNEINRLSIPIEFRNITINTICDMFTKSNDKAYDALVKVIRLIARMSNWGCLYYNYKINEMQLKNTTIEEDLGRQWTYQQCTEFGYFQTSTAVADLFGDNFPVDYEIRTCQDLFGTKFDKKFITSSIDWTNNYYGGQNIKARRVLFVQGSIDPWHVMGIYKSQSKDMPAIFINGTSHCADLYNERDEDSKELVAARLKIREYLETWLAQPWT
ncbi:unnamed protein product [Leptidea sinapis]|uniref:Serine protease K12H4.7 n=1 Tax=Leptidea sinapis TaxID=189913 RepID=A0A5E4QXK9_9NEOP|nr:unnamed protein product [Leptidea sinapis]